MATCSKSFLLPLLAFIIISYLQSVHFTEATAKEIKAICDLTLLPQACLDCLAHNDDADLPTLAKIGAGCSKSHTQNFIDAAFSYFGGAPAGDLKNLLSNCTLYARTAPPLYDTLAADIDRAEYGEAEVFIAYRIYPLVDYCTEMQKKFPELPWPKEVLNLAAVVKYDLSTVSTCLNTIN